MEHSIEHSIEYSIEHSLEYSIDRRWVPMPFPFVDGEHIHYFDVCDTDEAREAFRHSACHRCQGGCLDCLWLVLCLDLFVPLFIFFFVLRVICCH